MPDAVMLVANARIVTRALPQGEEARRIAAARALDPAIFEEFDPFIWDAEVSNNTLDFYGTRMHESSLRNYEADLTEGVAFQTNHDVREAIGRSIGGLFEETAESGDDGLPIQRVLGTFYTIPGSRFGGMGTDDFIRGVRAGILSDISIGFYSDDYRCGICGDQVFGWDTMCPHIPGVAYQLYTEDGDPMTGADGAPLTRIAEAWVHDGHLAETSQVYDGATDRCAILKARMLTEAGQLDERAIQQVERQFRTAIPRRAEQYLSAWRQSDMTRKLTAAEIATRHQTRHTDDEEAAAAAAAAAAAEAEETDESTEGEPAGDERSAEESEETVIELEITLSEDGDGDDEPEDDGERATYDLAAYQTQRTRLAATGIKLGTDPVRAVTALADALLAANERATELAALADLGRDYRADLIAEAVAEGVRAKGDKFNTEMQRGILDALNVTQIRALRDEWAGEAQERWGDAKRRTRDDDEAAPHDRNPLGRGRGFYEG